MDTNDGFVRIPHDGGVMREGPHFCPHDMAFPSAMMSLKVLMGGKHRLREIWAHNRAWRADDDYFFFAGVSGESFRFLFDTAEYFRFGHAEGGGPVADCFASEGIPVKIYSAKPAEKVDGVFRGGDELRALVTETLEKGFPALVFGRAGGDWVLLAIGYEKGSGRLIGWTFMPGSDMTNKSFSPEDCQFIKDWQSGADAVALVGGPLGEPADRKEIVRRALARGERFLRESSNHPHGKFVNFYDEWTDKLGDDAFWSGSFDGRPGIDPEIWDFAERRCYGADFMQEAADCLGTEKLSPAIDAFRQMHDLMWKVNALVSGEDEKGKLRDKKVRAQVIGILEECRELDRKSADAIAETLKE